MIAPEIEWLKKFATYALRIGYEIQSGRGTNAPTLIWADADYEVGDGKCGLHEGQKGANEPAIPYVRLDSAFDLADAAVAAAIERACERLADSWTWDDADFLSCVIADLKRHVIESGPTQKAKAALEQVRREARRNALLDAVAACRPHADDCALDRQAKAQCADMIQRLLDNPQEDKT